MAGGIYLQGDDYKAAKADLWGQDARGALADEWGKQVMSMATNAPPPEGGDASATAEPNGVPVAQPDAASTYRSQAADQWASQVQNLATQAAPAAAAPLDLAADSQTGGVSSPPPAESTGGHPVAPSAASSLPPMTATPTLSAPTTTQQPPAAVDSQAASSTPQQFSPFDAVFARHAPGDLGTNPEFMSIVAAGTLAESRWNPTNTTGDGGHSWGLFQMHDHGAGAGMGDARLDPDAASAVMVPKYAYAYQAIKSQNPNLSGPALAAAVAQEAERSADPTGAAYAKAYQQIMGGSAPPATPVPAIPGVAGATPGTSAPPQDNSNPLQGISDAIGGAAQGAGQKVQGLSDWLSQLGRDPTDSELSQFLQQAQDKGTVPDWIAGGAGALANSGAGQAVSQAFGAQFNPMESPLRKALMPTILDPGESEKLNSPEGMQANVIGMMGGGDVKLAGNLGDLLAKSSPEALQAALPKAQAAVDALRTRFPQMSPGSLAASGPGKTLAAIQEAIGGTRPATGDAAMLEPEVAGTLGQQPTENDVMRNFVQQAKASGVDTSAVEAEHPEWNPPPPAPPRPPTEPATPSGNGGAGSVPPPGDEWSGPALPQRGQLGLFGDQALPYGGPAPAAGGPNPAAGSAENALKGTQPVLPGFPNPLKTANIGDMLNQAHRGDVVSGLGTVTHVVGNTILSPFWSAVVHNTADAAGGLAGAVTGGRVGMAPGEAMGSIAGRSIGATTGLVNMGQGFVEAYRNSLMNPTAGGKPIGNAAARYALGALNAVGGALHGALMNATRAGVEHAELTAAAGQQAASEGLSGSAFTQRMGDLVANPSQLPAQALALAKDRAARASLQGEAGYTQQLMQKIANVDVLGNTLLPVVRIASQALAQTIEKSPIGLLGTGVDVARGLAGKGPYAEGFSQTGGAVTPLGDRVLNNLAGTAVTAFMVQKGLDGTITGNGPSDPGQLALLKAQGWQPNSIYVPGRGYVDYHALPVAGALAQAAAISDALQFAGPEATTGNQFLHGVGSLAKYVVTNTGLQTIGDALTIMQGGGGAEKAAASFAGNVAGGFVPFSGLVKSLTVGADQGPARKPDLNAEPGQDVLGSFLSGAGQTVEQNLPGLRQNVPLAQDVIGRNQTNPAAGAGAFLPQTGKGSADPVLAAFTQAGATIGAPPKTITVGNVPIQLTTEEQRTYQQVRGQLLEQAVGKTIADPKFVGYSQPQQRYVLEHILAAVDQAARGQALQTMGRDQLGNRITTGKQAAATKRPIMSVPQYVTR